MTKARVDLPCEAISGAIFCSADKNLLTIMCNRCSSGDHIFYEGEDTYHPETDWFGNAMRHLLDKHPDILVHRT